MRRLFLIPLLAALVAFGVACSDSGRQGAATVPTQAPQQGQNATPQSTVAPDGLQYVFDSVGGDINIDDMRPYLAASLDGMSDAQLSDAIFCFPSDVVAQIVNENIERKDGTATMTVTWRVTGAGAATIDKDVERTWTFKQVSTDGATGYEIAGLPQTCPFQPADQNATQEPAIETPSP